MKSSFEPHPLPGAGPGFVVRDLGIASQPEAPATKNEKEPAKRKAAK